MSHNLKNNTNRQAKKQIKQIIVELIFVFVLFLFFALLRISYVIYSHDLDPLPSSPPGPTSSPSRGGDIAIYVKDINQPSLPIPFYFVLVSVSVFMSLSTVFHSIKSPDNSPLSHSVLPVLFLPYWSFQLCISL